MSIELTPLQQDLFQEIGTIGAGNAATGLSRLLNKRVNVESPSVRLMAVEKVPQVLGRPDQQTTGVFLDVTGHVAGHVLLVLPLNEAIKIAGLMLGRSTTPTTLDAPAESALKEMGNITVGAYVLALSEVLKTTFMISVPALATELLQALVDGVLIQLAQHTDSIVVIQTNIAVEYSPLHSHVLFLFDTDNMQKILRVLPAT